MGGWLWKTNECCLPLNSSASPLRFCSNCTKVQQKYHIYLIKTPLRIWCRTYYSPSNYTVVLVQLSFSHLLLYKHKVLCQISKLFFKFFWSKESLLSTHAQQLQPTSHSHRWTHSDLETALSVFRSMRTWEKFEVYYPLTEGIKKCRIFFNNHGSAVSSV